MSIAASCSGDGADDSQYSSGVGWSIHVWKCVVGLPTISSSSAKGRWSKYRSAKASAHSSASPKMVLCAALPLVKVSQVMLYGTKTLCTKGKSVPRYAAAAGTIDSRLGGSSFAVAHWSQPPYEAPYMDTFPFDHGCAASHSTTSWPSLSASLKGSNSPSELPRPRTSTAAKT